MAKKQTFYQSKVSPEAYAAHEERMQQRTKERIRQWKETRGGDEGNISDEDIPPDLLKQMRKRNRNSK